jgi:hypothetical protein
MTRNEERQKGKTGTERIHKVDKKENWTNMWGLLGEGVEEAPELGAQLKGKAGGRVTRLSMNAVVRGWQAVAGCSCCVKVSVVSTPPHEERHTVPAAQPVPQNQSEPGSPATNSR